MTTGPVFGVPVFGSVTVIAIDVVKAREPPSGLMTSMATRSPDSSGSAQLPVVTAPSVNVAASVGVRMHGTFGSVDVTAPVSSIDPESVESPKNVYVLGSATLETFGGKVVLGGIDDGATTAEAIEVGDGEATVELAAGDVGGVVVGAAVAAAVAGLLEVTAGPIGPDDVSLPASAVAAIAIPATQTAALDPTAMPRRRLRRRIRSCTATTGSPAATGTPARSRRAARSRSSMSSVIAGPPSCTPSRRVPAAARVP